MRNLTMVLAAAAVAGLSLVSLSDSALAGRCKAPEKWNAVEGKCEKPAAAKPKAKPKA
jgi:hypothetical protein